MGNGEREIRLQLMLQPEELQRIEDWRFEKRMPSRASAIRELLRRGLTAEGFRIAEQGKRSGAYAVTDGAQQSGNNGRGKTREK
jgi:hypothetical protein